MKRKKWLKIFGILLAVLILAPIGLGMYLESRIGPILRNRVNQSISGTFDFSKASLSLLRSFPRASVRLEGLNLITGAPFRDDTLMKAASLDLTMDLTDLLREAGTPLPVRELHLRGMDLRLKVDRDDRPNYLISRESDTESSDPGFALDLQRYTIEESRVSYVDSTSGMTLLLDEVGLTGSGDLSSQTATLTTQSEGKITLDYDGTTYLSRNSLHLEAIFGMDFESDTYTFRENRAQLNQMPVVFQGMVQLREGGQWIDLDFQTPDTDFRNFLALIPSTYSGNLEEVETRGTFELEGAVEGLWSDSGIPTFELRMWARNGAFHYPDLPRWVEGVEFDMVLKNNSGIASETALEVHSARFSIARDSFALQGNAERLGSEAIVSGSLKGSIDLGNLSQAYPLEVAGGVRGLMRADLSTAFNMQAVDQKRYEDIKTSGTLDLSGVSWPITGYSEPLQLERVALRFDPGRATLEALSGRLGQSDFRLRGAFSDYLPYLLGSGGVLVGEFTLASDHLLLADFQGQDNQADDGDTVFKIPSDMEVDLRATVGKVTYHDLVLERVGGELKVSGGRLELRNFRSNAMEGLLALDGQLDTRGERPSFDLDLGITRAGISEAIESVALMKSLAPLASALEGTFNSRIRLTGFLQEGFSPDLMTLGGEVVAEVLTGVFSGRKSALLDALASNLDFFDPDALDLKGLKTALSFENGLVQVRPFDFKYKDIAVNVEGSHGFDKSLAYGLALQVPAHYLGKEVNQLLRELNQPGLENAPVPVKIILSGTFTEPRLQTDITSSATAFTSQLIQVQQERLRSAGTQKAQELIGDLLKGKPDSGKTATGTKDLSGLLKGVMQPRGLDSIQTDTTGGVQPDAGTKASTLLKNLLGKRKDTAGPGGDSLPRNH